MYLPSLINQHSPTHYIEQSELYGLPADVCPLPSFEAGLAIEDDFPKIAFEQEMNLIVCEMAHFGVEHITPYLEKCRAKHVIFNHYQLRKERDIQHLMQCTPLPFPISMAQDGDVVQVY